MKAKQTARWDIDYGYVGDIQNVTAATAMVNLMKT